MNSIIKQKTVRAWRGFFSIILATCIATVEAAEPDDPEITLFNISNKEGVLSLTKAIPVTRREGYDNQPHFSLDDKKIYYTRMENEKTDIWFFDIEKQALAPFNTTATSEYSPTPIAGSDALSVIRVEDDGTQRLWRLSNSTLDLILKDVKPVGYHDWIDEKNLGLFVLGEPHEFQIANTKTGKTQVIDKNIGRCIQSFHDGNNLTYTRLYDDKRVELKRYSLDENKVTSLGFLPSSNEDYVWYGNKVIASNGSSLMLSNENLTDWREIANKTSVELKGVSRLALSHDKTMIAIVHQ